MKNRVVLAAGLLLGGLTLSLALDPMVNADTASDLREINALKTQITQLKAKISQLTTALAAAQKQSTAQSTNQTAKTTPAAKTQPSTPTTRPSPLVYLGLVGTATDVGTEPHKDALAVPEPGFIVDLVVPDSPAATAKLQANDLITSINATPIVSDADMRHVESSLKSGSAVPLKGYRYDGSKWNPLDLQITPKAQADFERELSKFPKASNDGITMTVISKTFVKDDGSANQAGTLYCWIAVKNASKADTQGVRGSLVIKDKTGSVVAKKAINTDAIASGCREVEQLTWRINPFVETDAGFRDLTMDQMKIEWTTAVVLPPENP